MIGKHIKIPEKTGTYVDGSQTIAKIMTEINGVDLNSIMIGSKIS